MALRRLTLSRGSSGPLVDSDGDAGYGAKSSTATPFDDKVRSVRSKIQKMMAKVGEHSSSEDDWNCIPRGSEPLKRTSYSTYDNKSVSSSVMGQALRQRMNVKGGRDDDSDDLELNEQLQKNARKSLHQESESVRGAAPNTPIMSNELVRQGAEFSMRDSDAMGARTTPSRKRAELEGDFQKPAALSYHEATVGSFSASSSAAVRPEDACQEPESLAIDISAIHAFSSSRSDARIIEPALDGASSRTVPTSSRLRVGLTSDPSNDVPLLIGRDIPAQVGARVRVLDQRSKSSISRPGTIVLIACEGARVRVKHDGLENTLRYYNTGNEGEYELVAAIDDDETSSAPQRRHWSGRINTASQQTPETNENERAYDLETLELKKKLCTLKDRLATLETEDLPIRSDDATLASASSSSKLVQDESTFASRRHSTYAEMRRARNGVVTEKPLPANDSRGLTSVSTPGGSVTQNERFGEDCGRSEPKDEVLGRESPPSGSADQQDVSAISADTSVVPRRSSYAELRRLRTAAKEEASLSLPLHEAAGGDSQTGATQPSRRYSEIRADKKARALMSSRTAADNVEESCEMASVSTGPGSQPISTSSSSAGGSVLSATDLPSARDSGCPQKYDEAISQLQCLDDKVQRLDERLSKEISELKLDFQRQMGELEQNIYSRVLEDVGKHLQALANSSFASVLSGSAAVVGVDKSVGKAMEIVPKVGAASMYEPEQEFDCADRSPDPHSNSVMSPLTGACAEVSVATPAELADSRCRLQTIGKVARQVSASLNMGSRVMGQRSSSEIAISPSSSSTKHPERDERERELLRSQRACIDSAEDLEAEMQRLGELRRFASRVLNPEIQLGETSRHGDSDSLSSPQFGQLVNDTQERRKAKLPPRQKVERSTARHCTASDAYIDPRLHHASAEMPGVRRRTAPPGKPQRHEVASLDLDDESYYESDDGLDRRAGASTCSGTSVGARREHFSIARQEALTARHSTPMSIQRQHSAPTTDTMVGRVAPWKVAVSARSSMRKVASSARSSRRSNSNSSEARLIF